MIRKAVPTLLLYIFSLFPVSLYADQQLPIITPAEEYDLQLITTYQGNPGLFAQINHTKTTMGKERLKNILRNPTTDIAHLQKFQSGVQELIEKEPLRQKISNELASFARNESALYGFSEAHCSIADSTIADFYFQNKYLTWLNSSPFGLEIGHATAIANLFAPILEHAVLHFLISDKLHSQLGICCGHGHSHEGHNHAPASSGSVALYDLYNVVHMGVHIVGIKGMVEHVMQRAKILKHMQEDLIRVRACLHHAENIKEYMQFESADDKELKELLTLLQTNTFAEQASYASRPGNILRAYALMQKQYVSVIKSCAFVADIDATLSCALLYLEHKDQTTEYCFANYQNNDTPTVLLDGLWNPLMQRASPLENSLRVGTPENPEHIVIVTGPNKAGKTTGLSSCALAIVLAQTIGMSPAHSMILTPFDAIHTGLNMTGRVKEGQSLFSCSIDFAQSIIDSLSKNPEAKMLVVVDELFNSTKFELGQKTAATFIEKLTQCPQCMALVATHFQTLTELETKYPGICKNYKAITRNNNSGTTYGIVPGISDADVFDLVGDHEFIRNCVELIS